MLNHNKFAELQECVCICVQIIFGQKTGKSHLACHRPSKAASSAMVVVCSQGNAPTICIMLTMVVSWWLACKLKSALLGKAIAWLNENNV